MAVDAIARALALGASGGSSPTPTGNYVERDKNYMELIDGAAAQEVKVLTNKCVIFEGKTTFDLSLVDGWHGEGTIQYSLDSTTWANWDGSVITPATPATGEDYKIYLRGVGNTHTSDYDEGIGTQFYSTANVGLIGKLSWLLDYTKDHVICGQCVGLFKACPIVDASGFSLCRNLDTTVSKTYYGIFNGCQLLTKPPILPAKTLTDYCYYGAFSDCSALSKVPELPATTMNAHCYEYMFNSTLISVPPILPARTLAESCYKGMFNNCNALAYTPSLIATTMTESCYEEMFNDCSALTAPPVINATSLAKSCFKYMFRGCTLLENVPNNLGFETFVESCCEGMFKNCSSLKEIPYLGSSSLTLAKNCCKEMFSGCTSLTDAQYKGIETPQTAAEGCYESMFYDCTSLSVIPYNNFTTALAPSCCKSMFENCISITEPTSLPPYPEAPLPDNCYNSMYKGCTGIKWVTSAGVEFIIDATSMGEGSVTDMFADNSGTLPGTEIAGGTPGTPGLGTTYYYKWLEKDKEHSYKNTTYTNACSGEDINIINKVVIFSSDTEFNISIRDGHYTEETINTWCGDGTLEYSFDGYNYEIWAKTHETPQTLSVGSSEFGDCRIYIRGVNNTCSTYYDSTEQIYHYSVFYFPVSPSNDTIAKITIKGNFDYFLDYTRDYVECGDVENLFDSCGNIVDASRLIMSKHFNTGATWHYYDMFAGCSNLLYPPQLPATKVGYGSYCCMFSNCTSLTTAPALPATTLNERCYEGMFSYCTSLITPPALPATTLNEKCYYSMFYNCTSLTAAPVLPATTLTTSCYAGMFQSCISLTTPPALPATSLSNSCYLSMFYGCTSLTSAPALPATSLQIGCYCQMFSGCSSLKSAPNLLADLLLQDCYALMFKNCTSLTAPPTISAKSANASSYCCFYQMFYGCTSLKTAPVIKKLSTIPNCYVSGENRIGAYESMFEGCTSLVSPSVFEDSSDKDLKERCYARMFYGCTGINWNNKTALGGKTFVINGKSTATNAMLDMFTGNSGTLPETTGTPEMGTAYYYLPECFYTLAASSWSEGVYSFESIYPSSKYNAFIDINGDIATSDQITAWTNAKLCGSAIANKIYAKGTVPTIDIPIVIKAISK